MEWNGMVERSGMLISWMVLIIKGFNVLIMTTSEQRPRLDHLPNSLQVWLVLCQPQKDHFLKETFHFEA